MGKGYDVVKIFVHILLNNFSHYFHSTLFYLKQLIPFRLLSLHPRKITILIERPIASNDDSHTNLNDFGSYSTKNYEIVNTKHTFPPFLFNFKFTAIIFLF